MSLIPRKNLRPRPGRRLAELLRQEPDNLDICEAALCVAAKEYPDLDIDHELQRVRLIAAEGARLVYGMQNPFERLDGVRTYLHEQLGFRGNTEDYNDPRNCFLNDVLDRKLGIPLTLSILFIEVARAAGFEARGIGLPGHFVARATYGGRTVLVDPYHGGHVITEEDCRKLVTRTTGRPSLFKRELLEGTTERAMLSRLLLNLKHIYVEREDCGRALAMVDQLLLLTPENTKELRDRGFLKARMGQADSAIADLEAYLSLSPTAPDAESVRGRVTWLRRKLSELN